jgi:hypothetical protein
VAFLLNPAEDLLEVVAAFVVEDVGEGGLHEEGAVLVAEDVDVSEAGVLEVLYEGELLGEVLVRVAHSNNNELDQSW